jgi:hypothetical protein
MNNFRMFLAIGGLVAAASCPAAQGDTLLVLMSAKLRDARMAPQGPSWHFGCPKEIGLLIGTSQKLIEGSFGRPDYSRSSKSHSWTFYYSSTPPSDWRPRYPRLTFYFDPKLNVQRVTCFDG